MRKKLSLVAVGSLIAAIFCGFTGAGAAVCADNADIDCNIPVPGTEKMNTSCAAESGGDTGGGLYPVVPAGETSAPVRDSTVVYIEKESVRNQEESDEKRSPGKDKISFFRRQRRSPSVRTLEIIFRTAVRDDCGYIEDVGTLIAQLKKDPRAPDMPSCAGIGA